MWRGFLVLDKATVSGSGKERKPTLVHQREKPKSSIRIAILAVWLKKAVEYFIFMMSFGFIRFWTGKVERQPFCSE
jgi:amino acid transporter